MRTRPTDRSRKVPTSSYQASHSAISHIPSAMQSANDAHWNACAKTYDARKDFQALAADVATAIRTRVLDDAAKNAAVLDIGCGSGFVSQALAPFVASVVGVDSSTQMVETFNEKMSQQQGPSNCQAFVANATNYEAVVQALQQGNVPSQYHLTFTHMSLHHVEDVDRVLHTMAALAIPGGHVAVSDITRTSRSLLFHKDGAHRTVAHMGGFDIDKLAQQMRNVGLDNVQVLPEAALIKREVDAAMETVLPRWQQTDPDLFKCKEAASIPKGLELNAGGVDFDRGVAAPVRYEQHPIFLMWGQKL